MLHPTRLGNDIVDLAESCNKNKHRDARFIDRVFTPPEKECIRKAHHPDKVLWSLWAAKEAAYKVCKKENPTLVFSPQKFAVEEATLDHLQGLIKPGEFSGSLLYGNTDIDLLFQYPSESCVHCLGLLQCSTPNWDQVHTAVRKKEGPLTPEQQSIEVRKAATDLCAELGMGEDIIITRGEKIIDGRKYQLPPYLRRDDAPLPEVEVSLSHDGHWVAAALIRKGQKLSINQPT